MLRLWKNPRDAYYIRNSYRLLQLQRREDWEFMNPSQEPPKTVTIGGILGRAWSCAAHWNRFTAMSPAGVHCKGDVCNAFGRFWRLCLLLTVFLIETRFISTSALFHPKPCSKRGEKKTRDLHCEKAKYSPGHMVAPVQTFYCTLYGQVKVALLYLSTQPTTFRFSSI